MSGKRLYVSLGFDVTNILSSLLERGFGNGDELVLLVPKTRSERNVNAIKNVELLLAELGSRGHRIDLRILELDEHNPSKALRDLISDIKESYGDVYLDAVGGLRVICLVMCMAAMLVMKNVRITSVAENTGRRVEMPRISLSFLAALSGAKLDVLRRLSDGISMLSELEVVLGKDKSTLSKHLSKLEEMGLVIKESSKPAKYRLTELGELVLMALS